MSNRRKSRAAKSTAEIGCEIKILRRGDQNLLANVARGVFDHSIDRQSTLEFLRDPRHHLAVAIDHGTVVGMATAVHYVHPDKKPELWINEVAVAAVIDGEASERRS